MLEMQCKTFIYTQSQKKCTMNSSASPVTQGLHSSKKEAQLSTVRFF